MAIRYGASALGLVSEMPSGPGVITEEDIAEIAAQMPPGISTFLLTSKTDVASIINQHKYCGTSTIQLVDEVDTNIYNELKNSLPGIKLVQVIHVQSDESVNYAKAISEFVDGILLDSGNQNLNVKELGGTGRTHNWEISKIITEQVQVPVFLAGGLKPENILDAVKKVNPYGVDVCTGVRTNGKLDEQKLSSFVNKLKLLK